MDRRARVSHFVLMALAITVPLFSGCGLVAPPQAPSLYLPQPPGDLTASRTGNDVHLHWTMPKRAIDRALLKGDQDAHICRSIAGSPCDSAGDAKFAPVLQADFIDHLPPALASGSPRLITYTVELRNRHARTAGPSNPAYSVAGAAPEEPAAFAAYTHADGIVLHWQPASGNGNLIRIQRALAQPPVKPGSDKLRQGAEAPAQQTLELSYTADQDPGRAYDKSAAFDKTYRLTAQRIAVLSLQGHSIEVASVPSPAVTLDARDIFPPAVPTGLVAVASPDEHVIDLSWSPNTENDLAGYIVYRREAGSSSSPTRISPSEPISGAAFRDTTAKPGVKYTYSVSAVDQDKNESARSSETEESLPQ
ncbi:fibronectin type III domain-containing protein [Acidobacterium sp. S8]|uniref:fibronectin type III domain-containing protein n=1 Tax=Acidobacterium sp. S8 TaxID=1641854 RepID=UPI001C205BC6|nr:fibronectin type III domain-containing protein [Acidobacterium sp. S8]